MTTQTIIRRKRCSECNELKDDVAGRQRLCSECEQGKSYCEVCDEWEDRSWGDGCRHVQWDDDGGFECGCGAEGIKADDHKESFFVLLSKLAPLKVYCEDEPLVPEMVRYIKANNFWTFWHGPIIGAPPDLAFKYERIFPKHKSVLTLAEIPCFVQEAWGEEAIDAMQLGMAWLTSLDSKSKEANKITVGWIQEFLEARKP